MVRRPSVVNNFKHLLQNRLPDQSQSLCGASLGRGKSLFAASGSHDQDGRHAHIWLETHCPGILVTPRLFFYFI